MTVWKHLKCYTLWTFPNFFLFYVHIQAHQLYFYSNYMIIYVSDIQYTFCNVTALSSSTYVRDFMLRHSEYARKLCIYCIILTVIYTIWKCTLYVVPEHGRCRGSFTALKHFLPPVIQSSFPLQFSLTLHRRRASRWSKWC